MFYLHFPFLLCASVSLWLIFLSLILRHLRFVYGFLLASGSIEYILAAIEHHAQFAANGEELPTFLYACQGFLGAETMNAGGNAVLFARRQHMLERLRRRLATGRFAVLAAHAGRQIVGTDEDGIDTRHGKNAIGVLDRLNVFALQNDKNLIVGASKIIDGRAAEVEGVNAAADAARADGRIERGADGVECLLPAVDHRHDKAMRSIVEGALDVVVAIGWHTRQGNATGVGDGSEHVRGCLPIDERMFDVHGQPGEAGASQEARGGDTAQR